MTTATYDPADAAVDSIEELLAFLSEDERRIFESDVKKLSPKRKGKPTPAAWRERVPMMFPRYAKAAFADRHAELWEWGNAIELDSEPDPFCAFWPRGGAKSTSAEMLVTDLGCREKRKYVLYVRMTQDKADASVENIAALLESPEVAKYFPDHGKRKTGKFGNAKGWRRSRVWTAGGFAVDALGLDTASRGVKLEDQRPDMIVFDDIDDLLDSPAATKKKIETMTKSILPAGSNNVAVLFIQNLIIRDGVASQLSDGRADFLSKRRVSGPFPAVEGLKYQWHLDSETGMRRAVITAGTATWEGQNLETCQRNIDQWGLSAFLKEAQHKVQGKGEGVCLRFDPSRHYVDDPKLARDEQWRDLVQRSRVFAGIDFGSWRFGFTLWLMTSSKILIRLDEYFSQAESLTTRAQKIHELCVRNGIENPSPRSVPIWGDAANPQDIREVNLAFRNGWPKLDDQGHETGQWVTSKLRVIAVANENKARVVAVERINNALDKNQIRFRRGVNAQAEWMLNQNAGSMGTEKLGSRLIWEIDNWSVPLPKEGEAQDQNPDDDTADGADMIASMRYALMSWWRPGKVAEDPGHVDDDRSRRFDMKRQKFIEHPHLVDRLHEPGRRRPTVRGVRPRIGR